MPPILVQNDRIDDVKIVNSDMIVGQNIEIEQKDQTCVAKRSYADALKNDISF